MANGLAAETISPLQTPELRDDYEWKHLDKLAVAAGEKILEGYVNARAWQPIPGLEEAGERFSFNYQKDLQAEHPDLLVIPADVFNEMRYQAGIEASYLSDEEITAAESDEMWLQVHNEFHEEFTETTPNHYVLHASAFVISFKAAALTLAADYRQIAQNRLSGFDLLHFTDASIFLDYEPTDVECAAIDSSHYDDLSDYEYYDEGED